MSGWHRQKQGSNDDYSSEQVKRVIQASGLNIELEIDSDYIIFCPYHSNFRTPAAEISKTTGMFYCFGCQQSKTLIEFVMHCTKRSYFEAARMIDSKQVKTDIESDIDRLLDAKQEYEEYDMNLIHRLNKDCLSNSRAIEYLKSRSITKDSVEKYLIGYSENQDMITIPVYSPDSICVGFVARSVEGKGFKNSHGLPRSKTLFNLHRTKLSSQVFVVESSFDAIRIEQVGRSAVATLGANISNRQMDLLKRYFTSIILLPDNDEAGKSQSNKMNDSLGSIVTIGKIPDMYKDVSDMNNEQLSSLVYKFDNMVDYLINI